jgi:hypothetical protein
MAGVPEAGYEVDLRALQATPAEHPLHRRHGDRDEHGHDRQDEGLFDQGQSLLACASCA